MNRRAILGTVLAALAFWAMVPRRTVRALFDRLRLRSPLSSHEHDTLVAVAEHVYPETDTPGAISLAVERFFARQFGAASYRRHVPVVRRVVAWLDRAASSAGERDFVSADIAIQRELVGSMFTADRAVVREDFGRVIDMTIEGCFAHPRHGGNREWRAWQVMRDSVEKKWLEL